MRLVVPLAILLLAGCTQYNMEARAKRLTPLVGQAETQLVQAMGIPTRVMETGGHRFLEYDETRVDVLPAMPGPWGAWGPYGVGYGAGFPPEVVQRSCQTTFDLVAGRVQSFAFRGNACG